MTFFLLINLTSIAGERTELTANVPDIYFSDELISVVRPIVLFACLGRTLFLKRKVSRNGIEASCKKSRLQDACTQYVLDES